MLHDPKREAEIEFEIKIAKEPWRKIWLEAVRLLRENGHCRGTLQNERGEHCVLGAIYAIGGYFSDAHVLNNPAHVAAVKLGHYVRMPVAVWNDANSTETVIATLELLARS